MTPRATRTQIAGTRTYELVQQYYAVRRRLSGSAADGLVEAVTALRTRETTRGQFPPLRALIARLAREIRSRR